MSAKGGGPAFPVSWQDGDGNFVADPGMSLRDYFAGQVMAGLAAHPNYPLVPAATKAYEIADAMLAARTSTEQPKS